MSDVEAVETVDEDARAKKKAIALVLAFITAAVAAVIIVATFQLSQVSDRLESVKQTYGIDTIGYGHNATELLVTTDGKEVKCEMPSNDELQQRASLKCDDGITIPAK